MNKICKKCLLSEVSKESFETILDYINSLDESIKVNDRLYEERLAICKECIDLINGYCKYCGCFVEVRAVKKNNYCPSLEKKW